MQIVNVSRDQNLAVEAKVAGTFWTRLVGLLNRSEFGMGEGLVIKPCNSVHTYFMRFPIDVAFLDSKYQIVHIIENMTPFHFGPIVKSAAFVVELPAGVVRLTNTQIGDELKFSAHII